MRVCVGVCGVEKLSVCVGNWCCSMLFKVCLCLFDCTI